MFIPYRKGKSVGVRHLVLVLGDQLDAASTAFDGFDPSRDAIWMAEVREESTHIRSSKQRTAVFLSAMRHFAQTLRDKGWTVHYRAWTDPENTHSLGGELAASIARETPDRLILTAPGDWRVLQSLRQVAKAQSVPLDLRDDTHFFITVREFAQHWAGKQSLRMEFFYRKLRKQTGILMSGGEPVGGQWNFDAENRKRFGRHGPDPRTPPLRFEPDAITQSVMEVVNTQLADHPGELATMGWPVTREQALQALAVFVQARLPHFGQYQDALWEGDVWLYHSHLSCALNLKLLHPREVIDAAVAAWESGHAPLPAVEGFVRQILGWREYVRGIYWTQMPHYLERNALNAQADLPECFWTGQTDMACVRDALHQTLTHGYAHHIQRLMVTGLYAQLLGVSPQQVHAWYLGVYVDAVEWVELPNTLGMSQYADGGFMSSKPYVASGQYMARMSNHCKGCRYDPAQSTGDRACPLTTLYWDFLSRHEAALSANPRMALSLRNLQRLSPEQRAAIAEQAQQHRESLL